VHLITIQLLESQIGQREARRKETDHAISCRDNMKPMTSYIQLCSQAPRIVSRYHWSTTSSFIIKSIADNS